MVFPRTPTEKQQLIEMEKETVRKIKKSMYDRGARFLFSMYGQKKNSKTGEVKYVRIEVMSWTKMEEKDYQRITAAFDLVMPKVPYSLWTYSARKLKKVFPP